ncbi:NADP-dependent oxidoreductase domain-containing protein [Crepidotus variabilis]|uniref:NADP-dependent oxidoreductase domain-containing protein n=1 Tax=Crepidotus variabilis TaxID=179855 RepID=A0A9P6E4G2_9AGAR|nr:NADP-dependent oxidoreductase domain-containing protein [Crepidotus variabilis]
MSLSTIKIGSDNVTEIGFGAMGLSAFYGEVPSDDDRFKFLDAVLEKGCTNWDTADMYGDSEALLGKWFKRTGKRDQIFLASKFGISAEGAQNSAEYMRASLEKSLKLLSSDHLDLFYVHRINKNIPIEKTIRSMAELVKEGKIRYIGLSEISAETLRRAHAIHPIAAVQVEYSPFALDIERNGLLKACRELGVAVVAYSPLGRGLLTGAYKKNSDFPDDDFRKHIPKYSDDNLPKILGVVQRLTEIGKTHNATAGQICLAWLKAQGNDIIPIPGTKKVKYLSENLDAVKIKLNAEEVASIRKVVEMANIDGLDRYPAAYNVGLYEDTVAE